MRKLLSYIDLFGDPVKIYLNEQSTIKTSFGGVLTIIMFILIILASWFLGKDIILKQSPISYNQNLVGDKYNAIQINRTSFPFSVSIVNFNNEPLNNDKMLTYKLIYTMSYTDQNNNQQTEYLKTTDFVSCTYTHFPTLTKAQFDGVALQNNFCPEEQNFTLEGFWGESKLLYINLVIAMCDYDKFPNYCNSYDNIIKYIADNGANFNLFYLKKAIDVKNYPDPIISNVGSFYRYFDSSKMKVCEFFLETDSIITDSGLIFEDLSYVDYFDLVEIHSDTVDFNFVTKQLANVIIYASNASSKNFRKYIKVAEILASAGGIIKIIQIIFSFLNQGFSQVKKFETIIDNFFNFSINNPAIINSITSKVNIHGMSNINNNIILKNNVSNKSSSNLQMNIISLPMIDNNNTDNSVYNKIIGNLNQKIQKEKLNLNYTESLNIVTRCICKNKILNQKIQLYLIGKQKLIKSFDFINIIHQLEELEIMKKILFNENQRLLLDFVIHPKIDVDRNEKMWVMNSNKIDSVSSVLKLFLKNKFDKNFTKKDENLLNLLLNY